MKTTAAEAGVVDALLSDSSDERRAGRTAISPREVRAFVEEVLQDDVHAATVGSVSDGVVGALDATIVSIHAIGRALAMAKGLDAKHATKQFDRLLSNANFDVWAWFSYWGRYVIGSATDVAVILDWTDFDADDHTTLAAYVVTGHGRATPLLWKTVHKSSLRNRRNGFEREVIERLEEVIPQGVNVTLLADRGFASQQLFAYLELIGWKYVIRFKQSVRVEVAGKPADAAASLVPTNGHARLLRDVHFTANRTPLPAVVLKHAKAMKEPWCLATNRPELGAAGVVQLYSRRFTIEETFRDVKDIHFGLGLSTTSIGSPKRRDRLLFIIAIAHTLLTLLGAAGEAAGLDRTLKTNTSAKRTLSLYNQGLFWFSAMPRMRPERLRLLLRHFRLILAETAPIARILSIK